jgi:hypothetical protein
VQGQRESPYLDPWELPVVRSVRFFKNSLAPLPAERVETWKKAKTRLRRRFTEPTIKYDKCCRRYETRFVHCYCKFYDSIKNRGEHIRGVIKDARLARHVTRAVFLFFPKERATLVIHDRDLARVPQ